MTNPVDGVFYPNVTDDIPTEVSAEVEKKLSLLLGFEIKLNALFLRLSPGGVHVPHPVHTDLSMGKLAFMLYLNRKDDCLGGTSFVAHKRTGMKSHPVNNYQVKIWEADYSDLDKWQILDVCEMRPNRGLVFDASLMHCALPVGGFGKCAEDARLVLTGFLDAA
jgi:hypothetical protein